MGNQTIFVGSYMGKGTFHHAAQGIQRIDFNNG
jgi:hypothetical protein